MNSKTRFEALFSLVLAVLTDLISVIIAWAFSSKRNSILYAANISELTQNKEETLEDCYTFICFNKLYNNPTFRANLKDGNYSEMEREIINSLHAPLKEFVNNIQFHDFLPELNKCGYITYAYVNSTSSTESPPVSH